METTSSVGHKPDEHRAAQPVLDPRFEPMLEDALFELIRAREAFKAKHEGLGLGVWMLALEMMHENDLSVDGAITVAELAAFALKITDFERQHEVVLNRAYQAARARLAGGPGA